MITNQNTIERIGRVALGLALLFLFFVGPKTAWGLIGIVPLVTGVFGWCPLYQLFGVSTRRLPRSPKGA